jgi:predicted phage terminase large subunit-like protein
MDMPSTKEAVKALSQRWPKAGTKLVEDKASGPAVIQEVKHDVAGLTEVNPEGGKIARARAVSPQVESGNIYLPHPAIAPWIDAFIEEAAAFPNGRNDDQVDAMTQALNRLRSTTLTPPYATLFSRRTRPNRPCRNINRTFADSRGEAATKGFQRLWRKGAMKLSRSLHRSAVRRQGRDDGNP